MVLSIFQNAAPSPTALGMAAGSPQVFPESLGWNRRPSMSSWCHRDPRAIRDCQLPPLPASGLLLLLCCMHSAIAAAGRWGASAAQRLPSFSELPPKPFSTMNCGNLLSTAGRDQILRRDIHGFGSSPLPGDCYRQT